MCVCTQAVKYLFIRKVGQTKMSDQNFSGSGFGESADRGDGKGLLRKRSNFVSSESGHIQSVSPEASIVPLLLGIDSPEELNPPMN